MSCHICKEEKLFKEFVLNNLSEECTHQALFCMQCALSSKDSGICPYTDCDEVIGEPCMEELCLYEAILESMYPKPGKYTTEADSDPFEGDNSGEFNLTVVLLTGERVTIEDIHSNMTILELKENIFKAQGTEVEKQRLIYNEKELWVKKRTGNTNLTLNDYDIQSGSVINLLIMLYSIPDTFTQVTFDLNWGYPYRGKDYLDASCLMFNGSYVYGIVDYHNKKVKNVSGVRHSGDVMNDHSKRGHHTIEVNLKQIPRNVTHLFFTLSAYRNTSIRHFRSPNLKFYENKGKNLCSTSFSHALNSQAVVMCSMSRKSGSWQIYRSGRLSAGNVERYGPMITTIRGLLRKGV